MHYFLIAGEASGDLHASTLIKALRERDSEARFTFLGGDLMAQEAQSEPVVHYRRMAFMGFVDVVLNLGRIRQNYSQARRALAASGADCLILIDYPSFNLDMAEYAKKLNIPVFYFISPKVWAWKEYRVKSIRRLVDKMLCILPFEVDFYRRHGMEVDYVGNPSVGEVELQLNQAPDRADFIATHNLDSRPIIALLPGSRKGEIKDNLPVMIKAAAQFSDYQAVIAGAPAIPDEFYTQLTRLPVVRNASFALLKHAHAALVTSGTATLETALADVPQVVLYRSVGWKLTFNIMKHILKVRYVSLPNLIADSPIVPELLLHMCTPANVAAHLSPLLADSPERHAMLEGYKRMKNALGSSNAAENAAKIIISECRKR